MLQSCWVCHSSADLTHRIRFVAMRFLHFLVRDLRFWSAIGGARRYPWTQKPGLAPLRNSHGALCVQMCLRCEWGCVHIDRVGSVGSLRARSLPHFGFGPFVVVRLLHLARRRGCTQSNSCPAGTTAARWRHFFFQSARTCSLDRDRRHEHGGVDQLYTTARKQ